MTMYGQNHLAVNVDPGDLKCFNVEYFTQIDNQKIEINVGFNLQVVAVECVCVAISIRYLLLKQ